MIAERPPGTLGNTETRVLLAVLTERYPTVRSVAGRVGLRSSQTVHGYLRRLRAAGLVAWEDGRAGTLRSLVRPVPFGEP